MWTNTATSYPTRTPLKPDDDMSTMEQSFNDGLEGLTKEQLDRGFDAIKRALKERGGAECSLDALLNRRRAPERRESEAKCCPCDIVYTVAELEKASGCPKCGNTAEFEIDTPDEREFSQ